MSGGFLLAVGALWLGIGVVLSVVLGRRGHSGFSWFVLGTLLGPLAVALAFSSLRSDEHPEPRVLRSAAADLLDPYEPWLAGRVADDVVLVCEDAASQDLEAIGREVARRVGLLLRGAGVEPAAVACRLEPAWPDVRVIFTGPPLSSSTRQALSVRALDAIHAAGRTFGHVDVSYEARAA